MKPYLAYRSIRCGSKRTSLVLALVKVRPKPRPESPNRLSLLLHTGGQSDISAIQDFLRVLKQQLSNSTTSMVFPDEQQPKISIVRTMFRCPYVSERFLALVFGHPKPSGLQALVIDMIITRAQFPLEFGHCPLDEYCVIVKSARPKLYG